METIIEDTKTNYRYCAVMFFVFVLIAAFGNFEGIALAVMVLMCIVWLLGVIAFYRLHSAAKQNEHRIYHVS